ncbi:MAG TPA: hypothetical protein VN605_13190, partial [Thermoanaerobaculia bacterium]|nr:hypothetical protein [Thermoanaerobaculia bacterium]
TIELRELRAAERYVVVEPLPGSFGSASVSVHDICEHGVQIVHAHPLRIGTTARLWFRRGITVAASTATVVWSRLSQTPDSEGKLLYRSGIRLTTADHDFVHALQELAANGILRADADSLDRKRQLLAQREASRSGKPVMKYLHPELAVPSDQALLVRHARERLRANPEEARKWYHRAKFATLEDGTAIGASEILRDRDDVLAVWEYLERTVDLATVMRVFGEG